MTKAEILAIVFTDITSPDFIIALRKIGSKNFAEETSFSSMIVGTEWLIEAAGCDADALRDETCLRLLFDRVIDELGLKSVGSVWHKFAGEGGVTGLVALTESHLACHTYPEHGTATFNLYCCRTRPEWDWEGNLKVSLGARSVAVMKVERGDELTQTAGGDA